MLSIIIIIIITTIIRSCNNVFVSVVVVVVVKSKVLFKWKRILFAQFHFLGKTHLYLTNKFWKFTKPIVLDYSVIFFDDDHHRCLNDHWIHFFSSSSALTFDFFFFFFYIVCDHISLFYSVFFVLSLVRRTNLMIVGYVWTYVECREEQPKKNIDHHRWMNEWNNNKK